MDKKEWIIIGAIIIIIAVVAIYMYSPSNDVEATEITILNNNTLGQNNNIYVKLTNDKNFSLSDKTVKLTVSDKNKKTIVNTTAKTHKTGVAVVKLHNLSKGVYKINVTFDGDGNYTGSSAVKNITVKKGLAEENSTNTTKSNNETNITSGYASQTPVSQNLKSDLSKYYSSLFHPSTFDSSKSDSSSKSSSSSQSSKVNPNNSELKHYDENGTEILPIIDENGKITYDY